MRNSIIQIHIVPTCIRYYISKIKNRDMKVVKPKATNCKAYTFILQSTDVLYYLPATLEEYFNGTY